MISLDSVTMLRVPKPEHFWLSPQIVPNRAARYCTFVHQMLSPLAKQVKSPEDCGLVDALRNDE